MEIDEWFDKVDDLQTYILNKEKSCNDPIKLWTNSMDDTRKTKYESKVTNGKIVVIAKSKEVAAALFTLIRYKIDSWSRGYIVDDYIDECGVVDEKGQGQQITVENMFNVLVKHESRFLDNQDVSTVVVKKLACVRCVAKKEELESFGNTYVNIVEEPSDDGRFVYVEMELHRPLSEAEIYTPTAACLDRLLDY